MSSELYGPFQFQMARGMFKHSQETYPQDLLQRILERIPKSLHPLQVQLGKNVFVVEQETQGIVGILRDTYNELDQHWPLDAEITKILLPEVKGSLQRQRQIQPASPRAEYYRYLYEEHFAELSRMLKAFERVNDEAMTLRVMLFSDLSQGIFEGYQYRFEALLEQEEYNTLFTPGPEDYFPGNPLGILQFLENTPEISKYILKKANDLRPVMTQPQILALTQNFRNLWIMDYQIDQTLCTIHDYRESNAHEEENH